MSWTEELKEGDDVFIHNSNGLTPDKVKRLTKTMIILEKTSKRYKRSSGWGVGETGWYTSSLEPFSEKNREKHKKQIEELLYKRLCYELSERLVATSFRENPNSLIYKKMSELNRLVKGAKEDE